MVLAAGERTEPHHFIQDADGFTHGQVDPRVIAAWFGLSSPVLPVDGAFWVTPDPVVCLVEVDYSIILLS